MKLKKVLKIVAIICAIILVIEGGYLVYKIFFYEEKKPYFDSINSFEMTKKGYIAVGSNNNNEKGYEKAKITKYNSDKEKEWEKFYNNGYNGAFFDVAEDDGNFIAVGSYEGSKKEKSEGLKSALLVKYDKDGEFLFSKSFQVLGYSKFTQIKVVDDGYLVVGQSIFENMTLGISDEGGAFLIKYDKEGNILWQTNYGGSKSGLYNDILITDENIYTVGKDYGRVGIISKYTKEGTKLETVEYKYTDTLGFTGIAEVNGYLYVVGSKKVKEDEQDYDTDALIVKYNMDLEQVDEKVYQGKGIERFNQVIIDHNDDLVIAGQTGVLNKKESTDKLNVFSYDGIIAKYKEDLVEVFVNNYGDKHDDYFTGIKEDGKNYLLSGYSKYDDNSYLGKFIIYSKAGKVTEVK